MALLEGVSSTDDASRREGEEEGGEAVVGGATLELLYFVFLAARARSEGGWLGSDACIAVKLCAREAMSAAGIPARKRGARNSKM